MLPPIVARAISALRAHRLRGRVALPHALFALAAGAAFLTTLALIRAPRFLEPRLDEVERVELEVLALEARIAAAEAGESLLLLDPAGGRLTLFLDAAPIRDWPVGTIAVAGSPESRPPEKTPAIDGGATPPGRALPAWRGARLSPPLTTQRRIVVSDEVQPPDPSGAEEDFIPPLPEERVPTPPRFTVRFEGGLELEVLAIGPDSVPLARGLGGRLTGLWKTIEGAVRGAPRVQVAMPADEAGALYRAFPLSARFVALIPGQPRAPPADS